MSQETGEWSIPDSLLDQVWDQMVKEGKEKYLFWSGGITDAYQFIEWLQEERNFPMLLIEHVGDKINPVTVIWLNGIDANHALAHFCVLGGYDPEMARETLRYWKRLKRPDGRQMFLTLLAFIPENNERAIKTVLRMGFEPVGTIPNMCTLAYENNRTVGSTLMYFDLTREV
jgi:hypothetical protein